MQKDTATILIASVVLSAAIVGGLWYYNTVYLPGQADDLFPAHENQMPIEGSDEFGFYFDPTARTDQIIECEDPEIGTLYTNAAACEGADLQNRVSEAQPFIATYSAKPDSKHNLANPVILWDISSNQAPDLRTFGKPPPENLPPECRFPVKKALHTERSLAAAKDPYRIKWRETYCRFRREAIEEGCPVTDRDFYYSYRRMCG